MRGKAFSECLTSIWENYRNMERGGYYAATDGLTLKIKLTHQNAKMPKYAGPGDSGMDLYAAEDKTLGPGDRVIVSTGVCIELPAGTEGQVRGRSGLAFKNGISVLNSPGTIDQGYRGEIGVLLVNNSERSFTARKGMRIAQLVIAPVLRVVPVQVDELSDSKRGSDGFGSTGVS